jgi:hypothetical protein
MRSSNKSSSASVGVSVGTSSGFAITAAASRGKGKANGDDLSWSNTRVEAGDTLTLNSGGDTALKGAVAAADRVVARVGGDLAIESLQDVSTYDSKQSSSGFSISIPVTGFTLTGISGSISASKSKIESDFRSVGEQSGIRAGDGGFDVQVGQDTTLTGGAITSTQKAIDAAKNRFTTGGQLKLSDLENQAEYDAKGGSINLGSSLSLDGKLAPQGTSAGYGEDSGNASSTTLAAISDIAGNQAARTGDAETGLKPIFDAAKVQKEIDAQVRITQQFGQLAPKAVGNYANEKESELRLRANQTQGSDRDQLLREAETWAEGGINRVALHTLVGGLSGGVDGALGAAASSKITPILAEQITALDIPFDLKIVLIEATGAAVGRLAGGSAGASAGLNETANNFGLLLRAAQFAAQAAKFGVDKLSAAEAVVLQSCVNNVACRQLVSSVLPAGAIASFISQNTPTPSSNLVDQIPGGGYAAGDKPQPTEPLVNVPVESGPKDGQLVNAPPDVDTSLEGYSPEKPAGIDGPLVTPNDGPAGVVVTFNEKYVSSPKHDPNHGWGTPMDLPDSQAQQVLDGSTQIGKQRYGFFEGKVYEFQPDNAGGWHGYPIPGNEAPPSFLRDLRNYGKITNSEYGKLLRGR